MLKKKFISIFPYNNHDAYLHNVVFDIQKNKGREVLIFVKLKNYLRERNIYLNTYDIATNSTPYKYVYFDIPYPWNLGMWKRIISNKKKNILLCNESALVNPFNYMNVLHIFFEKVYTWNDELVDNKKYFKIRWPKSSDQMNFKSKKFKKKKLLILINANKLPFYPFKLLSSFGRELYSERIKAIEFFERTIPEKFYLYGTGWNKPKKYNLTELIFNHKQYSTYKGEINNKIKLLSNFKYCICFENLTDVNGYITEKIIDCFKAKCVPIYWGANDVKKYIPKDCFVDFRDFNDFGKLLNYLTSIDENTYNNYIKNIQKLLSNKRFIDMWFEEGFAKFFLKDILEIRNY